MANQIEKVTFSSEKGIVHHGWYIPAKVGQNTILYSGGNCESLKYLGRCRKILEEEGYGFLGYELPGYGRTRGKPTEENSTHALEAASDFLKDVKQVPLEKQVAYGLCLGAATTVQVASKRQFHGVILESLLSSRLVLLMNILNKKKKTKAHQEQFFTLPVYKALILNAILSRFQSQFNSLPHAEHITSPLLVIHADKDPACPSHFADEFFKTAATESSKKQLKMIVHDEHFIPREKTEPILRKFLQFLQTGVMLEDVQESHSFSKYSGKALNKHVSWKSLWLSRKK